LSAYQRFFYPGDRVTVRVTTGALGLSWISGTTTTDTTADITITKDTVHNAVNDGVACSINHPGQDSIGVTDLVAGSGPAKITVGSGSLSG
jgi:hypothetical protein